MCWSGDWLIPLLAVSSNHFSSVGWSCRGECEKNNIEENGEEWEKRKGKKGGGGEE